MKLYIKMGMTVLLLLAFVLLSGFRAQTIIHDDGSETQDVLKVADTKSGQNELKDDYDGFQKRNYTVMDYDNGNGKGFRAMKTITKDGASKSSVDRIVHKTHDGFICSTYYIDYTYDADSLKNLRLGIPMEENDAELEYIVSFPSGTKVISNSKKADDQGSTYMWSLSKSGDTQIKLQATVWHKLAIYFALILIVVVVFLVLFMERRRKNVISWKKAARLRRMEMMMLLLPIAILGYMGYEYYAGTHITQDTLAKVSQQQQEELLESREEDKRIHDAEARKQRNSEAAISRVKTKTTELTSAVVNLRKGYLNGQYSHSAAVAEARRLSGQAKGLLDDTSDLSEADKDIIRQLINGVVGQAEEVESATQEKVKEQPKPVETKRPDKNTAADAKKGTTDKNTGKTDTRDTR